MLYGAGLCVFRRIGLFITGVIICLQSISFACCAEVGVNRPELVWVKDEHDARKILETMAKQNVPAVRIMVAQPFDRLVRIVEYSNQLGIDVLLVVPLTLHLYYKNGTVSRKEKKGFYSIPPLSQLDIDIFTTVWGNVFNRLSNRDLRVRAFQIDNEFNSSVFNGDLPLLERGIIVNETNFKQQQFWLQYVAGMNKIVAATAVVAKSVRDNPKYTNSKIVLGGLARPASKWVENVGAIVIEPDLALRTLRDLGIDDHIDAYAIHLYPLVPENNWANPYKDIVVFFDERMQQIIYTGAPDKLWWITEWGFAMPTHYIGGCDSGDPRLPLFKAFAAVLSSNRWSKHIKETYVYDWDESARFHIWNGDTVLCSKFRNVFD